MPLPGVCVSVVNRLGPVSCSAPQLGKGGRSLGQAEFQSASLHSPLQEALTPSLLSSDPPQLQTSSRILRLALDVCSVIYVPKGSS